MNLLSLFSVVCIGMAGTETSAEIISLIYVCLFYLSSWKGVLTIVLFPPLISIDFAECWCWYFRKPSFHSILLKMEVHTGFFYTLSLTFSHGFFFFPFHPSMPTLQEHLNCIRKWPFTARACDNIIRNIIMWRGFGANMDGTGAHLTVKGGHNSTHSGDMC